MDRGNDGIVFSGEMQLIYIGHNTVIYKCGGAKPKGQVINCSPRQTFRKKQHEVLLRCDEQSPIAEQAFTKLGLFPSCLVVKSVLNLQISFGESLEPYSYFPCVSPVPESLRYFLFFNLCSFLTFRQKCGGQNGDSK